MHRIYSPSPKTQRSAGNASWQRSLGPACALLTLGMLMLCGCDNRPQRVPVAGQVLIDGQPLTYGSIRFLPKNARPSLGEIDSAGHFTLMCFEQDDGVVMGQHQIEITAVERLDNKTIHWHAPKKYANLATSGLTETITKPTDSLVINLTWGSSKPFNEDSNID